MASVLDEPTTTAADRTIEKPPPFDHHEEASSSVKASTASAVNQEDTSSVGDDRPDFEEGDHVYQWCSLLGVPGVFAHHGIVVQVAQDFDPSTESKTWFLWVADFDNRSHQKKDNDDERPEGEGPRRPFRSMSSSSSSWPKGSVVDSSAAEDFGANHNNNLKVYKTSSSDWKKVRYGVGFWNSHLSRGGTVTRAESDPPGLVLARVRFLLGLPPDKVPPYDALRSNCECIAVWCKCGRFCSLQGVQVLGGMVATQTKSTAAVAGAVATTQVTVPAAGVWGWLGGTTQVGLLTAQPWLIPALFAGGTVAIGGPALILVLAKGHWKAMTEALNADFWDESANHPDLLVDLIQHYRNQGYHPVDSHKDDSQNNYSDDKNNKNIDDDDENLRSPRPNRRPVRWPKKLRSRFGPQTGVVHSDNDENSDKTDNHEDTILQESQED